MLKKALSVIYVATVLVIVLCVPMSAIMLICKAATATAISWLGACVPLLVAIAASPFMILSKILLDLGDSDRPKK